MGHLGGVPGLGAGGLVLHGRPHRGALESISVEGEVDDALETTGRGRSTAVDATLTFADSALAAFGVSIARRWATFEAITDPIPRAVGVFAAHHTGPGLTISVVTLGVGVTLGAFAGRRREQEVTAPDAKGVDDHVVAVPGPGL